ncbi:MAG: fatty acid desaturase [Anaerolineaceae bacterium]|nr:fatty acid desaturase [Anaerolineaceae bacterium]
MNESVSKQPLPTMAELKPLLAPYTRARTATAIWEMINTLIPYAALWYLMYLSLKVSYFLTLGLAVIAALFLTRIFIFFHDCGHNSFFPSTQVNRIVGFFLGILVLTPSEHWWHAHAIHHATSGNLDKRGTGDVTTMTVDEYQAASPLGKLGYRLFRFPLIMFGLGPIYMFVINHRLPFPLFSRKETLNVLLADLALIAYGAGISALIGFWNFVLIQLPVIWIGGAFGIWMFYVQHQFSDAYWAPSKEWNYVASALRGASYYKLPRIFQWFSGNIGFHQIHHLSPRVPEYNLESCYLQTPLIQENTRVIDFKESLQTTRLRLLDVRNQRMITF